MPTVEASVQASARSLLQAEGRTCEDFQDEDHYSPSSDSSLSPFDGDLSTTSSSLSMDSLTTEGKGGEKEERGRGEGLPPRLSLSPTGIISGSKNCHIHSQMSNLRLRELGSLAGKKQNQV